MMGRVTLLLVLLLGAVASSACDSSRSPTGPSAPATDFGAQFDSLWTTFDREYSYFDYKRIDWNALRDAYRPRAIAAADQFGFISVVREMLGTLHDQHVVLRNPTGASLATYDPQFFVNWDRSVWQQYIGRANWMAGQGAWGSGVLDGVPYITIEGWDQSQIRTADFDAAIERFRGASRLILDVRMNPGGNSQLAFEIAGRFVPTSTVAANSRFRSGPSHGDFGPVMPLVVNPRGAWQFTGAITVLIGRRCASSNELFIAALRQLPNVTLVGDVTAGSSGNPGSFPLASGWSYTVSRWISSLPDGQVIEDVGIAPHVFVTTTAGDFMQGRDPVLDWALAARP
jgi:hypothetical protein